MVITSIGEARWDPLGGAGPENSGLVWPGWHKFEAAGSLREPDSQSGKQPGVKSRSLGYSRILEVSSCWASWLSYMETVYRAQPWGRGTTDRFKASS